MNYRRQSSDEERHRFPISLAMDVDKAVVEYAKKNRHSLAVECEMLIEEAIAVRRKMEASK